HPCAAVRAAARVLQAAMPCASAAARARARARHAADSDTADRGPPAAAQGAGSCCRGTAVYRSGAARGPGRRAESTAASPVRAAATLLPVAAPVFAPMRWCVAAPAAEERRRAAVITHGYPQNVDGHIFRRGAIPRPVVPLARIPLVIEKNPVQSVVKKVVRV